MKCYAVVFFKRDTGDWVQPGTIVDLEPDEAALWRSRGAVKAYRTEMVKQPETRVVNIPSRRRKRNVTA